MKRNVVLIAIVAVTLLAVQGHFARDKGLIEEGGTTEAVSPVQFEPLAAPSDSNDVSVELATLLAGSDVPCESRDRARSDGNLVVPDTDEQVRQREEQTRRISESLSLSSSPEHLYIAALLSSDRSEKLELLKEAIAGTPTDAFLLWSAYELCSVKDYLPACPMASWEQLLIDADGANSQVWVRIAVNRYESGDQQGALDAMRYAATASKTQRYWPETIETVERGLSAAGDLTFQERAEWAFGMTAAIPSNMGEYAMCKAMSPGNGEWSDVCLRYGQLSESQGRTALGTSFGRSIQKAVLSSRGDAEALAAVEERVLAYRRMSQEEFAMYDPLVAYLMISIPEFFHAYLDSIKSIGEYPAKQRVEGEIRKLIQDQPELACTPVPQEYMPAEDV